MKSFEERVAEARTLVRARGFADCIAFAPRWQARANALYAELNESGIDWTDGSCIGLLADGRMAIVWATGGYAEPVRPSDAKAVRT